MDRYEFEMQLADYVGGEMDDTAREKFELFIASDEQAKRETEELLSTSSAVRELPQMTIAEAMHVTQGLMKPRGRFSGAVGMILRYAAVLVLGVGIGWLGRSAEPRSVVFDTQPIQTNAVTQGDWVHQAAHSVSYRGSESSFVRGLTLISQLGGS